MTNHKILLVDDDRDVLEMLLSIFRRAGYTNLITAASGAEAIHDTQDSLGIAVDALLLQHQPHPAVAIGTKAAFLLLRDDFCKSRVFLRPAQSMDKIIISASGYLKEAAHDGYWIFVSMPMDHCVFCSWPHFLSMERRKSRNSSFSIFSRLFSFS